MKLKNRSDQFVDSSVRGMNFSSHVVPGELRGGNRPVFRFDEYYETKIAGGAIGV